MIVGALKRAALALCAYVWLASLALAQTLGPIPYIGISNTWSQTQTFPDAGTWSTAGLTALAYDLQVNTGAGTCTGYGLFMFSSNQPGICANSTVVSVWTPTAFAPINFNSNALRAIQLINSNGNSAAQVGINWRNNTSTAGSDCATMYLNSPGVVSGYGPDNIGININAAGNCPNSKFFLSANLATIASTDTAQNLGVHRSLTVGMTPGTLTLPVGGLGLAKITADGSAPGATGAKIELVCGTNAGSAKLIAYAGTSSTPVTILDNIGSGVTGC